MTLLDLYEQKRKKEQRQKELLETLLTCPKCGKKMDNDIEKVGGRLVGSAHCKECGTGIII